MIHLIPVNQTLLEALLVPLILGFLLIQLLQLVHVHPSLLVDLTVLGTHVYRLVQEVLAHQVNLVPHVLLFDLGVQLDLEVLQDQTGLVHPFHQLDLQRN